MKDASGGMFTYSPRREGGEVPPPRRGCFLLGRRTKPLPPSLRRKISQFGLPRFGKIFSTLFGKGGFFFTGGVR